MILTSKNDRCFKLCFESCAACTNGIGVIDENNLSVYPNPTKGLVFVKSTQPMEVVELIDPSGRVILHIDEVGTEQSIDLSSLEIGSYFVRIKSSGGIHIEKVVKQ